MTTQTKSIKQYFPIVLFIMLCKAVLTFESVDENPTVWPFKSEMKAIEQYMYFPVKLFIML